MSDPVNGGAQAIPPNQSAHAPFPAVRLIWAFAFGILAYLVLGLLFVLAALQFVVFAVNGRSNEELRHFCVNLVQYLWELVGFVTFVRDEQPFPIGPFPKAPTS